MNVGGYRDKKASVLLTVCVSVALIKTLTIKLWVILNDSFML